VTGYLHALVEDAAREAGCTVAQMLGAQKNRRVVAARWRVIRTAYGDGFSSGEIGAALNMEPSSVRHALSTNAVPHANTGGRRPRYPSYPQAEHTRAVSVHAV
jgi:hypothetical protein